MSSTAWLVIALGIWSGIGGIEALLLGRRGFDGFSWVLIGMVLGPLSVLVAWDSIRSDARRASTVIRTAGAHRPDGIDVLIGFDGSPECRATADAVATTFGDRLGRVALVSVGYFDDAPIHEAQLRAALEAEGRRLRSLAPDLVLVGGHPATALAQEAEAGGYDLVAVGATGRGHAHVFGSAARELVRTSPVPVFVGGQHARRGAEAQP
jgi:nucleotide-binding universal stress UspA family protein